MGQDISTPAFARPDDYYRLPEMTISCIFKTEDGTDDPRTQNVDILGVKFDTFSMTVDANDIVLQDVNFYAERIKPSFAT